MVLFLLLTNQRGMTHCVMPLCYTVIEIPRKETSEMAHINRISSRTHKNMEVFLI